MYSEHVPIISHAMRRNKETFMKGCMFAILSARVQFPRVPEQMVDVQKNGPQASSLWSWKFDAFTHLTEHLPRLYALTISSQDTTAALERLCTIPGMGIVKGAFILQMLGHDVACLDVRNIEREGLNPRAYRTDGRDVARSPAYRRKIARYVEQTRGRAQHYWDIWCTEVAADYGLTAQEISFMHVKAIVPKSQWYAAVPPIVHTADQEIPF